MQHIKQSLRRISNYVIKTPLLKSNDLSTALGCELFFKYEHLQVAGSIKARGAFLKVLTERGSKHSAGFVTASTGNHGLSVALATHEVGAQFKLFVPTTTPQHKIEKARSLGADVALFGTSWDEANQAALAFSKERGWHYIHTFDDETIVAGHATAAYECIRAQKQFDIAICSIGGGGIANGFLGYLKNELPNIRCYGVETIGADSMFLSISNDKIISLQKITSIASSLGVKAPAASTFDFVKNTLDGLAAISDHAAAVAQVDILDSDKQLVELAASCCVAALQANQIPDIKNKRVLVLLCGGNVLHSELGIQKELTPKGPIFMPVKKQKHISLEA